MQIKTDAPAPKPARSGRRRSTGLRKVIAGLILLLVLALLFKGRLIARVSNVQFLTRQEVAQIVSVEGILYKHENVLHAPVGGELHLVAADGDRLKAGARAAQVVAVQQETGGEAYDVATPVAGICCTHLDGFEQILSPDSIEALAVPKIEKTANKSTSDGMRVEKGQPVLKIIDNLSPVYVYLEIPKSYTPDPVMDKPVQWQAAWERLSLKVKPFKVSDKEDRWEGYFALSDYPDQLLHHRNIRLNITTRTLEGFLVPQKAIVMREGQPGIYLSVKKKACWTQVTIDGELDGLLAVSGPELTVGSRYVNNPLLVREGYRVE